jgi:hypothetical protein
MKRCAKCGKWKEDEEFAWRNNLLGLRQKACRSCRALENAQWYERHQAEQRERVRDRLVDKRGDAQQFIYQYLSNQVCADCGEYDFSVLTFDHVRGKKKKEITRMVSEGYSIEAIKSEIAKCEVVCFNCHMRRESWRRSGGRFRRFWPKFPGEE